MCDLSAAFYYLGFSCSSNETDLSWKIFGGYQVNQYLGVEANYVDLGTFKISANGTLGGTPDASVSEKVHAYGFGVDLVLSAPISNDFSVYARAGAFRWTVKDTATAGPNTGPIIASLNEEQSASGISPTFGAGARYDFAQNLGVRVEFQRFMKLGDENKTGQSDVDLISASLLLRFK